MKKFNLFAICVMACLLAGCEPKVTEQKPTVLTLDVTDVTTTSAIVNCNVVSDGGASVTDRGVAYDTYPNPKATGTRCKAGTGIGKYSCTLTNLEDNKKYYVRAYAKNEVGIEYGKQITFITVKELFPPKVSTDEITDILATSATVTGTIVSDGGIDITECGIVYSTSEEPTISNDKVTVEEKTEVFRCELIGLQEQTTYYVRAYAVNEKGVAYGEEKSFCTPSLSLPTVSLSSIADISYASAIITGEVSDAGNSIVSDRGIVYGLSQNPTTSDNKVQCGDGLGTFTCSLKDLEEDSTTYYVRAYAINVKGISYSDEKSFKTVAGKGFSVGSNKKIIFSKGNLQYNIGNKEWRFAENQTDFIGGANDYSYGYSGWIDLFRWSLESMDYYADGQNFVDWGTNQIGSDAPNTWRTLTKYEWEYLLDTRTNAYYLKGVAQVNGINGLILLPDNWTCPAGVTFKKGFHCYGESTSYYADHQTFTAEQWSKLEAAGAVFLPAAGYLDHFRDFQNGNLRGFYWSATESHSGTAFTLWFAPDMARVDDTNRTSYISVRLVKDL